MIYANEKNGKDSNLGTISSPFKTLDRCIVEVGKIGVEKVRIKLSSGTYTLGGINFFGSSRLQNVDLTIIGDGEKTTLIQNAAMGEGKKTGSPTTTITIAKLIYHFEATSGNNYNMFKYKWVFNNVLFTGNLNANNSVFLPTEGGALIINNSVKLTSTKYFLRTTNGTIEVRNSQGFFTSGFSTNNNQWDKGGNNLTSVEGYLKTLNKGLFKWNNDSRIILKKNNNYGYYKTGKWYSLGDTLPSCDIIKSQGMPSLETLNPGDYDFTHPMTTNAPQKQYSGVINFNDESLKNIKKIDVREVEIDG